MNGTVNRRAFMMRAFRQSFQIQLFAAITGMTLIFIAVTGYFSYLLGRHAMEGQIEQYAIGTVGQIAERVRTYLSQPVKNVSLLRMAMEHGFVDPADHTALIRFFHLMQRDYPEFLNINYGDRGGRFIMVPPQRPEIHKLYDPRIRPWYVGAVEKMDLYWTGVYVFASSQHPGITVSTPILDTTGTLAGVCSIDIDLSSFSQFLRTLKIGQQGYAYIIDNTQDQVIAHPDLLNPQFDPERIRLLNEGLAHLKADGKQFGVSGLDGEQYYSAYVDYPENNWSIGVNLPVTDFLENINAIKKATFTLVLVAIAISCVVSYLLSLTIVRPLRLLEQGIKRVSEGDLDHPVRLDQPHIVSSLAETFNHMAASLKQSRGELEQTYFELAKQEKMAALGQLTAGIAHEIKNPLGIILGAAQVLANPQKPEAMKRRATQFIIDEVIRLNNTLKSFLAFARPVPPRLAETDLVHLLTETLQSISDMFARQAIAVETVIAAPIPPCKADADQMRQVFLNILLNAAQSMPDGGRLTVRCALVVEDAAAQATDPAMDASDSPAAGRLAIEIADTGAGIPAERLETIFEPFATFKDDGTGLGLSIVAQILKMHRAGIRVDSTLGQGSTFTILFPLAEEVMHAV